MKRWIAISAFALALAFWILPWHALAQVTHGLNWTWNAVTSDTSGNTISVDGYNVYCGTSPTGPFTKANSVLIPGVTYLQTGLTVGNTYYCQVTAVKGGVESARSITSTGAVFQFPPVAPTAPSGVTQ